ncbi:MAG TPA: hypothetical protein VFE60_16690 [Roseiarcus sp.]|jgi:hypothetical protein|nr:hypothetical protein [Roseiarcus sp.]
MFASASGLIELSDLSAFQIIGPNDIPFGPNSLSNLEFFSYDTGGGASTLGFIDALPHSIGANPTACSGAPSVLSLACNPGGNNPASTRAAILFAGVFETTPDSTSVTLVPSVNTKVCAFDLQDSADISLFGALRIAWRFKHHRHPPVSASWAHKARL